MSAEVKTEKKGSFGAGLFVGAIVTVVGLWLTGGLFPHDVRVEKCDFADFSYSAATIAASGNITLYKPELRSCRIITSQ